MKLLNTSNDNKMSEREWRALARTKTLRDHLANTSLMPTRKMLIATEMMAMRIFRSISSIVFRKN
jgi:hypothetical protein